MSPGHSVIVRADQPATIPSPWRPTEIDSMQTMFVLRGAWLFAEQLDDAALRQGLAAVLSSYPHLAGRMRKDRAIELSNEGVPFTTASLPELGVGDVIADSALAHRFAPKLRVLRMGRGREPVLKVKLTRLRDGTLLNVTASHVCMDGRAFYAFVQSWARCCTGRPIPAPLLDTSCAPAPLEGTRQEARAAALQRGWAWVRLGTILRMLVFSLLGLLAGRVKAAHFPQAALRRLRKQAARDSGCANLRTFEALSAHLVRMCRALVKLPPSTVGTLVTIIDTRDRVPALPARYAANAPFGIKTQGLSAGATLGEIARRIHESLEPYLVPPATPLVEDVALARAIIRHKLWLSPYDPAAMHALPPTLLYLNNFATLPVYDVDFGPEGAPVLPVRAFPHDLPDPVLIWPAPPSDGGVEVYLSGALARAFRKLAPADPWLADLHAFHAPSQT